jgi:hypothetical protein
VVIFSLFWYKLRMNLYVVFYFLIGIITAPSVWIKYVLPHKDEITVADALSMPMAVLIWPGFIIIYFFSALDKIIIWKR